MKEYTITFNDGENIDTYKIEKINAYRGSERFLLTHTKVDKFSDIVTEEGKTVFTCEYEVTNFLDTTICDDLFKLEA